MKRRLDENFKLFLWVAAAGLVWIFVTASALVALS